MEHIFDHIERIRAAASSSMVTEKQMAQKELVIRACDSLLTESSSIFLILSNRGLKIEEQA